MQLNIKDADTHALAKRLASLTGESMAKAVKRAIQEKLARVERRCRAGPRLPMNWTASPCIAPGCRDETSEAAMRSSGMTKAVFLLNRQRISAHSRAMETRERF